MHIHVKAKTGAVNAKVAEGNFQKIRGMMFMLKPEPMFFEFTQESVFDSAVHMLFVFFPLDLVFLNSKWEVVGVKRAIPFYPYYAPEKPATYLLELPEGQGKIFKVGEKVSYMYY